MCLPISHQLSGLEERLGVTLFERVRKRMVITPAGQRLAALAAEVLPKLARKQALLRALRRTWRKGGSSPAASAARATGGSGARCTGVYRRDGPLAPALATLVDLLRGAVLSA